MIEVTHLTKKFGRTRALDDISFTVKKGEVHGFLGPNGAGKTTTIKILMDYLRPTKGIVTVLGKDARREAVAIKRSTGYLAGDMELYDNLTGHQYLTYIARLRHDGNYDHLKKLIDELQVVLHKKIGTLSRGNQQKIGLMAALMGDPNLLILDEPTSGLDPLMQQKFYKIIRDHAKRGKAVFMSSHILSEVQEVCDVVTFMKQGKIVKSINVKELLESTRRHVELTFSSKARVGDPGERLGATNLKRTKTSLRFDVPRASRDVMRWIAMQPVENATITESGLDAVFMDMYEEKHRV